MKYWCLLGLIACHSHPAPAKDTIDVDLKDAELADTLRVIAGKGGVNLFVDPDVSGTVSLQLHAVPWRGALERLASERGLRIEPLEVPNAASSMWVSKQSSPPAPRHRFAGDTVALDFHEAPIRDVAKTLGDAGKTTISVDDDVQANVTLRLRNVPWDLVLFHMAQKYQLHIAAAGGGLRIANH